jgi:uroporphyrinogen decarboxylase
MTFDPNYQHIVDAACNRKPERLPLYEHIIAPEIMSDVLGVPMEVPKPGDSPEAYRLHYAKVCRFWREMTYDTVSFEAGISDRLPGHGAIMGGMLGPIQTRADFDAYPFDTFPDLYWAYWEPHLDALAETLPDGMKLIGGCGNGVFELSEDLVGYEPLCVLQFEDAALFADVFVRIGDLMVELWSRMIEHYGHLFAVFRMGDDLGFKTSTLLAPPTIVDHIIPQYRRIIDLAHQAEMPFLLHSCGKIFSVMDDLLDAGIDAKHSNEDEIVVFDEWITRYGDRIGNFGGIDVNVLTTQTPEEVFDKVVADATRFRGMTTGFALGSGNSIADYVPAENYRAMVKAAQHIRAQEAAT